MNLQKKENLASHYIMKYFTILLESVSKLCRFMRRKKYLKDLIFIKNVTHKIHYRI